MTRKQALEHYMGIVKNAIEVGIRPRCHFEDITRADFYGFVVPFALELRKLSEDSGVPIKIRACDTLGLTAFLIPG
jgi:isopropylmalate/homocitrate/citramalate synthase